MSKHVTYALPAPFHSLDLFLIEHWDGEDEDHVYYATDLYVADRDSDTGLRFVKHGSRRAVMKFVYQP